MKHHRTEPDLDTETGLPTKVVMKLVWKIAISSLILLQAVGTYMGRQMIEQQKKTASDVVDLKIQVARIQMFLKMAPMASGTNAFNPSTSVAVLLRPIP